MPIIKNIKKKQNKGENKSRDLKKEDERKYKKGKDSDSEDDNSNDSETEMDNAGTAENGEQKFDIVEYRKMLADMFPSKYMDNRIEQIENENKKIKTPQASGGGEHAKTSRTSATNSSNKKSSDADENKKVTRSSAKAALEQVTKSKENSKENKPNEKSKKKGSYNPPPPEEEGTSSTSTNCSDNSENDDDKYSAGFEEFAKEQLQSGKFNIVINLMNDKKNGNRGKDDSDYDSEEEEWESDEDDDEYDSEDDEYDSEDDEYDSEDDSEDDDDDDEDEDPEYHPDEDEDAVSGDIKGYKYDSKKTKQEKTSKDSKTKGSLDTSTNESESLETIQKIKAQMEEILKFIRSFDSTTTILLPTNGALISKHFDKLTELISQYRVYLVVCDHFAAFEDRSRSLAIFHAVTELATRIGIPETDPNQFHKKCFLYEN